MRELTGVDAILNHLGGTNAVAEMLGIKPPSVSEWRNNGAISPRFFLIMLRELNVRGCTASPKWWKIKVAA